MKGVQGDLQARKERQEPLVKRDPRVKKVPKGMLETKVLNL